MALTLGGALKAYLESLGLGISVYTDSVPPRTNLRNLPPPQSDGLLKAPYIVFTGDIDVRLDPLEDGGASTGSEEVQLDLYQNWRDANDKVRESSTLADAITRAVQGAQLSWVPDGVNAKVAYGMLERARRRELNRNERLVRHIYQVDVRRTI